MTPEQYVAAWLGSQSADAVFADLLVPALVAAGCCRILAVMLRRPRR